MEFFFPCLLTRGQDKPRLEKAVNVDFVPFIRGVRVLCKARLIFSRITGPNVFALWAILSLQNTHLV